MDCTWYVLLVSTYSNLIFYVVEVRLQPRATMRYETIRQRVDDWLHSFDRINLASVVNGWKDIPELASAVEQIAISESPCPTPSLALDDMALQIHVYQTTDGDAFEEFANTTEPGEEGDGTTSASICELPNRGWEGLWDSLIYADNVKLRLLDYIYATVLLSDADVDCERGAVISSLLL
jgi:pachytene checkpoint protein 2